MFTQERVIELKIAGFRLPAQCSAISCGSFAINLATVQSARFIFQRNKLQDFSPKKSLVF